MGDTTRTPEELRQEEQFTRATSDLIVALDALSVIVIGVRSTPPYSIVAIQTESDKHGTPIISSELSVRLRHAIVQAVEKLEALEAQSRTASTEGNA